MARRKASSPSAEISDEILPKFKAITALTDAFCERNLNGEYAETCRRLAAELARKQPTPLKRGRAEVWACGIVRTIGWANLLDDPKSSPYMKLIDIDPEFGVANSTSQGKSMAIKRMFGIGRLNVEWTLPSRLGDNPIVWRIEVDGMLVDIRQESREEQEEAFKEGLIPYIPADRENRIEMLPPDLINRTANHVQNVLSGDGTGHDWWHVYRVWKMAQRIGQAEGADMLVVELAALLHDIADWKLHGGDSCVGPRMAREWLESHGLDPRLTDHICHIIAIISFKGAAVEQQPLSLEGQVVQDADRLDAMGAIGIARAFAYGGAKGRAIYDPAMKPTEHSTPEAYLKGGTSVNHFYEKLLLLKDRMNTATGRAMAEERHQFMEEYLRRFFEEWEGQT